MIETRIEVVSYAFFGILYYFMRHHRSKQISNEGHEVAQSVTFGKVADNSKPKEAKLNAKG